MTTETRLERIERLLETIDGRLSKNAATGERNSSDIKQNRQGIEQNGESIAFLLKKMDEAHQQIIRHFEIAREDFRSEMRALGEGMGIYRDRLDDHEQRLSKLESTG